MKIINMVMHSQNVPWMALVLHLRGKRTTVIVQLIKEETLTSNVQHVPSLVQASAIQYCNNTSMVEYAQIELLFLDLVLLTVQGSGQITQVEMLAQTFFLSHMCTLLLLTVAFVNFQQRKFHDLYLDIWVLWLLDLSFANPTTTACKMSWAQQY